MAEGTGSSWNDKYVLGGVESSTWAHAADCLKAYPRVLPVLRNTSIFSPRDLRSKYSVPNFNIIDS